MDTTAVAQRPRKAIDRVDEETLTALLDWVVRATPEEVAWNADQFQEVRDWLRASRAAEGLRMKATRLELVALRKIGSAGLSKKVHQSKRYVADWLWSLSDEGFSRLLADVNATDSPIGLYRRSKKETEQVELWHKRAAIHSGTPVNPFEFGRGEQYAPEATEGYSLASAARALLEHASIEGVSFTVSEAADELARQMESEGYFVPPPVRGEALAEAVRTAIRVGDHSFELLQNNSFEQVRVPRFVTYGEDETRGWVRIPWAHASVEQVRFAANLQQRQAEAYAERAAQITRLADVLEEMHDRRPAVGSAARLLVAAMDERILFGPTPEADAA